MLLKSVKYSCVYTPKKMQICFKISTYFYLYTYIFSVLDYGRGLSNFFDDLMYPYSFF